MFVPGSMIRPDGIVEADQYRANDHNLDDIVVRNSGGRMASGLAHNALIVTAMSPAKMSF